MANVNPLIFRAYDIRGVVEEDFPPEVVELVGRAYGTQMVRSGHKRIVVGRDCRLSSPELRDSLVSGIEFTGLEIIDVGVCPTPLLYFAIRHYNTDGGIMITGSHNPPEFNGFKICIGHSTIFGEEIKQLRTLIEKDDFEKGSGTVISGEIVDPYLDHLKSDLKIDPGLKVVVDGGNGTGGPVATRLFHHFGCDLTELYCEMDGRFPNHHPDPTVEEFIADLIRTVGETGADVGIAYDGDADRIGVVDDKQQIIWGDQLMIIFSREILREKPGATIISEVKASQRLYDDIAQHGGNPIMWKTGHSLIKAKMKETNALLAGEMSGHIFFADRYFGYDDAIYASGRLLEIISRTGKKVSELLDDVPPAFVTPEIRVDCPDEKKFKIVEAARKYFAEHYDVNEIDGVRIKFPDGWGLVRASNTQPVLVLRFEAQTEARLDEMRSMVESKIAELDKTIG